MRDTHYGKAHKIVRRTHRPAGLTDQQQSYVLGKMMEEARSFPPGTNIREVVAHLRAMKPQWITEALALKSA